MKVHLILLSLVVACLFVLSQVVIHIHAPI